MKNPFVHYLKIVAAAHAVFLIVFFTFSGCHRFIKKKPVQTIPIEFLVEVPQGDPAPKDDGVVAIPKKKKVPKKKSRKKITKSDNKIVRDSAGSKKKFTDKDIEKINKLLAQGAKPSNRTVIPEDEQRCMLLIYRALYDAWDLPSKEEVGDAVAKVEIELNLSGHIVGRRMVKKSGNAVLDSSAMAAIQSVKRVRNLSEEFLKAHKFVTVDFEVK